MTDKYQALVTVAEDVAQVDIDAYSKIMEAIEFHRNGDPIAGAEYLGWVENRLDELLGSDDLTEENRRRASVAKGVVSRTRAEWLSEIPKP